METADGWPAIAKGVMGTSTNGAEIVFGAALPKAADQTCNFVFYSVLHQHRAPIIDSFSTRTTTKSTTENRELFQKIRQLISNQATSFWITYLKLVNCILQYAQHCSTVFGPYSLSRAHRSPFNSCRHSLTIGSM